MPVASLTTMATGTALAIDVMGGDIGARLMLAGAARATRRDRALRLLLVGDEAVIAPLLPRFPDLAAAEIVHAPETIAGSDKPAQALRRARTTSMGVAIACVKSGRAAAAVSGGNTGALMAMAKLALRTMPGISRPALAGVLPSLGDNDHIMLDLGANTECDTRNLVEFAVMGAAYARIAIGLERPRVRLLNIGSEDMKGTDEVRDAAATLREATDLPMQFDGFIEGDKISRGECDVVVTDGFSGNIALKTAEGTARFVTDLLKRAFTSSLRSKVGFLVSRPATELIRHHLDPNNHNGAVFLGLNGIVVKSHGSASEQGVAHAIGVAAKLAAARITERIADDLEHFTAYRALVGA